MRKCYNARLRVDSVHFAGLAARRHGRRNPQTDEAMTRLDPAPLLEIRLLGRVQIAISGQPVSEFVSDKALLLFCYLACNPGSHSRQKVAEREDKLERLSGEEEAS